VNHKLFIAERIFHRDFIPFNVPIAGALVSELTFRLHDLISSCQNSDQVIEHEHVTDDNVQHQEYSMGPVLFVVTFHMSVTSQHAIEQGSDSKLNVHIVDGVLLEQGSEDGHGDCEVQAGNYDECLGVRKHLNESLKEQRNTFND
jgi:hypothetical protein